MEDFLEQIKNDHHPFDQGLLSDNLPTNPFELFKVWYKEAYDKKVNEPNALSLATVDENKKASNRIVYLKELLDEKYVFYTNYASKKGTNLAQNNFASMLFFWPELQRQIRIDGTVEKVAEDVSDTYFASRPRESQLGAWASQQSQVLDSRDILMERLQELASKYPNNVPRPPHWGGYALSPESIEFWQGRPSRLHDRFSYQKIKNHWEIKRLNP